VVRKKIIQKLRLMTGGEKMKILIGGKLNLNLVSLRKISVVAHIFLDSNMVAE